MNGNLIIGGEISQDLRTIPGHYYQISFALNGNWFTSAPGAGQNPKTVLLKFVGTDVVTFTANVKTFTATYNPSAPDGEWRVHSVIMATPSPVTRLSFESTTTVNAAGW